MRRTRWAWLQASLCLLALLPLLPGCGGSGGSVLISKQQEISIGQNSAAQLEQKYGVSQDAAMNSRLQSIGMDIVAATGQASDWPWRFRVLNTSEVNAMALPGGFVYATKGLMQQPGLTDAELAGVLGHEASHVTRRHSARLIERSLGAELLVSIATGGSSADVQRAAGIVSDLILLRGYRGFENDSDRWGTIYAARAGYDPAGLLNFLRQLKAREGREPAQWTAFLQTHPLTSDRINRLENLVARIRAGQVPEARPGAR